MIAELEQAIKEQPGFPLTREFLNGGPEVNVLLKAGDRLLAISIYPETLYVSTNIDRVEEIPRIAGLTTALYSRAYDLMREAARVFGHPLVYTFCTDVPAMIEWAKDPEKGKKIFQWDKEDDDIDDGGPTFEATKTIRP